MSTLGAVFRELAGLFVDDGLLALEIVAVVVLAGMSAALFPGVPMAVRLVPPKSAVPEKYPATTRSPFAPTVVTARA